MDGEATPSVDKPADAKADTAGKLCLAMGEPADCDPCAVAGWYGDGECDAFCKHLDTADCAATTETEGLLARADLVTSVAEGLVWLDASGTSVRTSLVATELSRGTADAWAETLAPMVGDGLALHVQFGSDHRVGSVPTTIPVARSTRNDGTCPSWLTPDSVERTAAANVFRWSGAHATPVACSLGGSLTARWIEATNRIELALDVAFSDGTVLTARTLSAAL